MWHLDNTLFYIGGRLYITTQTKFTIHDTSTGMLVTVILILKANHRSVRQAPLKFNS